MQQLLGTSMVICALAGVITGPTPHLAGAQTTPPAARVAFDSPAEQGPVPPERPTGEGPKRQALLASPAGMLTDALSDLWEFVKAHWPAMIFLCFIVCVFFGLGVFLGVRWQSLKDLRIDKLGPSFFFWLSMGYAGLLLATAIWYNFSKYGEAQDSYLLNRILPIAVPWFGALGAVTISMEGVFLKNDQWKAKFNYWHIGRPVFGAVLGIVAFFVFVVIASASGTQPDFLETGVGKPKDFIVFYVVAFLVGYREETFRDLIKRATDLILKPGTPSTPSPAVTFKDGSSGATLSEVSLSARPGQTSGLTVAVQNTGDGPLLSPSVSISVTSPTTAGAGTFVTTDDDVTGGKALAPGQARTVKVIFNPPQSGTFLGTLALTDSNLPEPVTIRVRGTAS